jgi:hypothetical protein
MNRRRSHDPTGSVSLFPFLAVLICTMGSLILLLVVVMQQARTRETAEAASDTTVAVEKEATPKQLTAQGKLEDLTWQISALTESRETTLKRLQDAQLQLSMTEDQTRQLQEQLDQLEHEAQQLEAVRDRQLDATAAQKSQLESISAAIAATRAELVTARDQAARRGPSFAIIPYKGPAGTDRRPIYVECQEDRVVLQPEGIELVATDFREPIGPGNPLATALRAIREYWLNARLLDSAAHAYPLLIVRSQGAHTYAACRQALRGWDDEFGYELIPDSMELKYPAADPSLTRVVNEAIREARMRGNLPDPQAPNGRSTEGSKESFQGAMSKRGDPTTGVSAGMAPGGNRHGHNPAQDSTPGREKPATTGTNAPPGGGRENVTSQVKGMSGGEGGELSPSPPGAMAGSASSSGAISNVTPLAASQGENWALPNSADGSIGMSRPVVVLCEPTRLVLPPASGDGGPPEEFAFAESIQAAIPPFVDALWRRIDSWGTAGYGAYWKPTLQVAVDPNAEDVYQLFVRLMESSGLQIERRPLE